MSRSTSNSLNPAFIPSQSIYSYALVYNLQALRGRINIHQINPWCSQHTVLSHLKPLLLQTASSSFFVFFLWGEGGRVAGGGERRRISLTYLILTLKINISIYGGSKTLCHQNYVLLLLETDAPNTHNIIFHYCARQTAPACALQV